MPEAEGHPQTPPQIYKMSLKAMKHHPETKIQSDEKALATITGLCQNYGNIEIWKHRNV